MVKVSSSGWKKKRREIESGMTGDCPSNNLLARHDDDDGDGDDDDDDESDGGDHDDDDKMPLTHKTSSNEFIEVSCYLAPTGALYVVMHF